MSESSRQESLAGTSWQYAAHVLCSRHTRIITLGISFSCIRRIMRFCVLSTLASLHGLEYGPISQPDNKPSFYRQNGDRQTIRLLLMRSNLKFLTTSPYVFLTSSFWYFTDLKISRFPFPLVFIAIKSIGFWNPNLILGRTWQEEKGTPFYHVVCMEIDDDKRPCFCLAVFMCRWCA